MSESDKSSSDWVGELVDFLRTQPGVTAVRIDPVAHRVAVATVGRVEVEGLEEKLAATIAAVEARLEAAQTVRAPVGYSLRQEGGTTVLGRDTCVTAEKLWLWREVEWPEIK